MTRILSEGFEMRDLLSLHSHVGTEISSTARSGSYSIFHNCAEWARFAFPAISEGYIRIGVRLHPHGVDPGLQIVVYNGPNLQIDYAQGPLNVYLAGTKVISGSTPLIYDTWHLIELHYKIDSVVGKIETKVNGLSQGIYEGNTVNGSSAFSSFRTGTHFGQSGWGQLWFDDIAVNDVSGEDDNGWCGDGHILLLGPNGNGDRSELIGSDGDQVDNYLLVDDRPSDGMTSFVSGENIGDVDLYNFSSQAVPEDHIIARVWEETTIKDSNARSIKHIIKVNGVEYKDTVARNVGTSFLRTKSDEYLINPNTGEPWTLEELDAIQAGIEVTE